MRLVFPAIKDNSVEIAYISYKKLRYTFDKFAERIDGRVLVPSPHVKACDFLGYVEFFFLKPSSTIFPLGMGQASRSMKKTTSCTKATELPG